MPKHTPAPWTLVIGTGSRSGKYKGNYEIAEACTDEEHAANADIIEGAPILMEYAVDLINSAYIERDASGTERVIVQKRDLEALRLQINKMAVQNNDFHVHMVKAKPAPSEAMRDVLEWILQPDHAIGSNAEMLSKTEEKVRRVLRTS